MQNLIKLLKSETTQFTELQSEFFIINYEFLKGFLKIVKTLICRSGAWKPSLILIRQKFVLRRINYYNNNYYCCQCNRLEDFNLLQNYSIRRYSIVLLISIWEWISICLYIIFVYWEIEIPFFFFFSLVIKLLFLVHDKLINYVLNF